MFCLFASCKSNGSQCERDLHLAAQRPSTWLFVVKSAKHNDFHDDLLLSSKWPLAISCVTGCSHLEFLHEA